MNKLMEVVMAIPAIMAAIIVIMYFLQALRS